MTELKKFEYFFLRYAPYPMMDDYVTFGVVMLEHAPNGFAGVHFMENYERLRLLHPDADLDYFNFLKHDINEHLQAGMQPDELLARMHDCFGNAVKLSPYRECLAEDGASAMELLARGAIDLAIAPQTDRSEPRGRRLILNKIQHIFDGEGIWDMVFKNVPVADYTYPGDPLKIDVSYRTHEAIKMIQAVSLKNKIDGAKALSFSYPQLVAGIQKKEGLDASLTVVVEDNLDRNVPHIAYAFGIMERTGITVAVATHLPILAEKARTELMA